MALPFCLRVQGFPPPFIHPPYSSVVFCDVLFRFHGGQKKKDFMVEGMVKDMGHYAWLLIIPVMLSVSLKLSPEHVNIVEGTGSTLPLIPWLLACEKDLNYDPNHLTGGKSNHLGSRDTYYS